MLIASISDPVTLQALNTCNACSFKKQALYMPNSRTIENSMIYMVSRHMTHNLCVISLCSFWVVSATKYTSGRFRKEDQPFT